MNADFCLRRNIISDKCSKLYNSCNCCVFEVYNNTNKIEVKKCVENILGAKVKSVKMINRLTKSSEIWKKGGKTMKRVRVNKIALVYLLKGEEINFSKINEMISKKVE